MFIINSRVDNLPKTPAGSEIQLSENGGLLRNDDRSKKDSFNQEL